MITKKKRDLFLKDLKKVFEKHKLILVSADNYDLFIEPQPESIAKARFDVSEDDNEKVFFMWERSRVHSKKEQTLEDSLIKLLTDAAKLVKSSPCFTVGLFDNNGELHYAGYERQRVQFSVNRRRAYNKEPVLFPLCPPSTKATVTSFKVFEASNNVCLFEGELDSPFYLDGTLPLQPRFDTKCLSIKDY